MGPSPAAAPEGRPARLCVDAAQTRRNLCLAPSRRPVRYYTAKNGSAPLALLHIYPVTVCMCRRGIRGGFQRIKPDSSSQASFSLNITDGENVAIYPSFSIFPFSARAFGFFLHLSPFFIHGFLLSRHTFMI